MKVPRALAKYVDVVNHPGVYIKAEIDKITHNIKVEASNAMGKIIVFAMLGFFSIFLLSFASLTLALFLNSVLDSWFYGFLIVTGLYLLIVVFLLAIRNNDSLQRKMFGLPEKKQPIGEDTDPVPPSKKVDPTEFGVAKPHEDSQHPLEKDRRVIRRTVIRPSHTEPIKREPTERSSISQDPVKRDPVKRDPVVTKTETLGADTVQPDPIDTNATKTAPVATEPTKPDPDSTTPPRTNN